MNVVVVPPERKSAALRATSTMETGTDAATEVTVRVVVETETDVDVNVDTERLVEVEVKDCVTVVVWVVVVYFGWAYCADNCNSTIPIAVAEMTITTVSLPRRN